MCRDSNKRSLECNQSFQAAVRGEFLELKNEQKEENHRPAEGENGQKEENHRPAVRRRMNRRRRITGLLPECGVRFTRGGVEGRGSVLFL